MYSEVCCLLLQLVKRLMRGEIRFQNYQLIYFTDLQTVYQLANSLISLYLIIKDHSHFTYSPQFKMINTMKHFNLCNAYEYIDYEICVPKQNSNKRLDACSVQPLHTFPILINWFQHASTIITSRFYFILEYMNIASTSSTQ